MMSCACQVEYDIHTAKLYDAAVLADEHDRLQREFQLRVSVCALLACHACGACNGRTSCTWLCNSRCPLTAVDVQAM